MKRVTARVIVADWYGRKSFEKLMPENSEIEEWNEKPMPKDDDILQEHSFDMLLEGLTDMANGIWSASKGFFKLGKWAVVLIIEGLKFLWKGGIGSKKKAKVSDSLISQELEGRK